jgi:hypothetical protein
MEREEKNRQLIVTNDRRWLMRALLVCVSAGSGFGSESAYDAWEQLYEESFTDEERKLMEEERERKELEELERQRAHRRALLAGNSGGVASVFTG